MGFCSNCGSELKEGAFFCTQCGTRVAYGVQQETINTTVTPNPAPNTYVNDTTVDKKPSNNKLIGMAVVGVAALLALFLIVKLIGLFTTPGYERPVKYIVDGMENGKFKTMMKAFPDYILDDFEDQIGVFYDGDMDDIMDDRFGGLEALYGKRIRISYDVKDKEKLNKAEIIELENHIDDTYGEEVNIKSAYTLDLVIKMKGSENSTEAEDSMTVIKIGTRWYLSDFNLY